MTRFVLEFLLLRQILEKNNLREERFIWAHSFRGFSLSWQEGRGGAEQLTLLWLGSRERKRMSALIG
jgi:hypothetical protein